MIRIGIAKSAARRASARCATAPTQANVSVSTSTSTSPRLFHHQPSIVMNNYSSSIDAVSAARRHAYLNVRYFSDKATKEEKEPTTDETETPPPPEVEAEAEEKGPVKEAVLLQEAQAQVQSLKDQLLRSLAEQENTRTIAKRDVQVGRDFAIKSFAKSLVEVSDNLDRALDAVPEASRADAEKNPVLANMYEGILMTNQGLQKAFAQNGLTKFTETPGEVFDPEKHQALFEYPDPTKTPGTVGQVMKVGFMLNKRVLRPAEVGVIKKV
jgi:molecular chaperone GrpE